MHSITKLNTLNIRVQTVDLQVRCEIVSARCIFGHARVRSHVVSPRGLDGKRANFSADFTYDHFIAALDLGIVKKPRDSDGRIAFSDCALKRNGIACINWIFTGRKGNYLRQDWDKNVMRWKRKLVVF